MIRTLRMPAALVASLCLSSIPLLAQHGGGRSSGHASASHAVPRASAPRASASRVFTAPARGTFGRPSVIYAQSRGGGSHVTGPSRGTAVVRGTYGGGYRGGYNGGVYRGGGYRGGYYGGYYNRVYPIRYSYPYYSFRPHFHIGFGIFVGYPIAFSSAFYYGYPYYDYPYYGDPYYSYPYYSYPYSYSYPYPYYPPASTYGYPAPYGSMNTYPPAGGYPADPQQQSYPQQQGYPAASQPQAQQNNSTIAQPGSAAGGMSFDITPSTAAVIIDGTFVGRASDLGPTTQPMGLKPGQHRVEIRAPGYETVTFDADIVAGQVLPYKGQMQPIR